MLSVCASQVNPSPSHRGPQTVGPGSDFWNQTYDIDGRPGKDRREFLQANYKRLSARILPLLLPDLVAKPWFHCFAVASTKDNRRFLQAKSSFPSPRNFPFGCFSSRAVTLSQISSALNQSRPHYFWGGDLVCYDANMACCPAYCCNVMR
jgi:hypothetical protein